MVLLPRGDSLSEIKTLTWEDQPAMIPRRCIKDDSRLWHPDRKHFKTTLTYTFQPMETAQAEQSSVSPLTGETESAFTKAGFWRAADLSRIQLSAAWSHLQFQYSKFYNHWLMKKGASSVGHSPWFQQGSQGQHFLFGSQRTHLHNTQALQKQTIIN